MEYLSLARLTPQTLAVVSMLALAGCGGGGSSSGSSTTVSTSSVPGAPTIGTATAGDGSASISFTAPSTTGSSAITSYTATCTASSASITGSGSSSPITVSGLTNGVSYSCSVTATNSVGTSAASSTVSVTPAAASGGGTTTTGAVDCPYTGSYTGSYSSAGTLTATWNWTCSSSRRSLTGNGLPNHAVGTFPNTGNPNTISAQTVSASMTLTPSKASANVSPGMTTIAYALNSVKFDPGTAGTCPSTATSASNCNLANGTDTWRLEALGPNDGTRVFDFGTDSNNAHVQPTGVYHYHGMPEGLLTNAGASSSNKKMVLVGWAADGYPVYARYCYSSASDATSALKVCTGSYKLVSTVASGRPSTSWAPLGWFTQDWTYSSGSGDLDDCNGRTGVTPEFPNGIYYYVVTDTYPYYGRCLKGNIN